MVVTTALTTSAVDLIAAGLFAKSDPLVVEAYSEPDRKPLGFSSATELATYISTQIAEPRGLAFVFVVYPDMRGRPVRKTIQLDPKHCPGQKFRYTWDGWDGTGKPLKAIPVVFNGYSRRSPDKPLQVSDR